MRAIGTAQRQVVLRHPNITPFSEILEMTVDVQGIHLDGASDAHTFTFVEMARQGVLRHDQQELTVWQRLLRKPACIGSAAELPDGQLRVIFWTDPVLHLTLHPETPDIQEVWGGIRHVIQAGGFCLELPRGAR